jgi:hypothetical protein
MVATWINNRINDLQSFGERWRGSATLLASDQAGQSFEPTPDRYTIAERYYANAMYERADSREAVIQAWYGLPRNIRPVLSIVKPAVNWWPDTLFGGVWTADGLSSSDGLPNILPYDSDTPEEVRLAVQTAFTWGNGAAEIPAWSRQSAMLGDAFGEIEIVYPGWREDKHGGQYWVSGKAFPKFWHPKWITDIEWDGAGNVTSFTIQTPRKDEGVAYTWGKTITKATITTLYNGEPMGYNGEPATQPNPWRFVPAVWNMHINAGGQHGESVTDGLYPVIDEVNGIVGSVDDFIHKLARQPKLIETPDTAGMKRVLDGQTKPGPTWEEREPNRRREELSLYPVPPGTVVHDLIKDLGLAASDPHVQRLLANIDMNLPELSIDQKLAQMSQVTGPGGRTVVAPMQRRVNHVFGNIASSLGKLGQMACTINGELIRRGQFGSRSQLSDQQRMFLPFGLDSFANGDLNFSLVTPKLLQPTRLELATEAAAQEMLTTASGLRHLGYSDDEIYGVGNVPAKPIGLLAELEGARSASLAAF